MTAASGTLAPPRKLDDADEVLTSLGFRGKPAWGKSTDKEVVDEVYGYYHKPCNKVVDPRSESPMRHAHACEPLWLSGYMRLRDRDSGEPVENEFVCRKPGCCGVVVLSAIASHTCASECSID